MTQPKRTDRHRKREGGIRARPDPADRDRAREVLQARGWTMNDFLIACVRLLPHNPDPFLRRLDPFRPPPTPPGRPKTNH